MKRAHRRWHGAAWLAAALAIVAVLAAALSERSAPPINTDWPRALPPAPTER